jgi:lipoyl(octanoyl) transferase
VFAQREGFNSSTIFPISFENFGLKDYTTALTMMQDFTTERDHNTSDQIWFMEHYPVFSCGIRTDGNDIPNKTDTPIVKTDRGGQVTYHGPGQLLVYTLFDLKRRSLRIKDFIVNMETIILNTVHHYKKSARLNKKNPGIYIDDKKICSFGLKITHGCTYHGASINVSMDLKPWNDINVCGHNNQPVTDLKTEGILTNLFDVSRLVREETIQIFSE